MYKLIKLTLALGLILTVINCATTDLNPTQKPPGFLPNYSLLKPVPSPEGMQIYTYTAPGVKRSDYHAAIIAPVLLYQNATESGISSAQIEKARINIDNGIKQVVSKNIAITNNPGVGVAQIYVGITGAILEEDGFKPRNLMPISAAIKLASLATNTEKKKPILIIEIKTIDSLSKQLLKETVTTISGEKFRMSSNTAGEFEKLSVEWVRQALNYSEHK